MNSYLPKHIYKLMLATAKCYPDMTGTEGYEYIRTAIKKCMDELPDDVSREMIKRNLFFQIPMNQINLPISESSMKRIRKKFLLRLAEEMKCKSL